MLEPWIVVTHKGLGLQPVTFREGHFTPACDPASDESVIAAISASLRFDKHVARDYAPGYSPHICVDEEIWYRIKAHFRWVPRDRIAIAPSLTEDALLRRTGATRGELAGMFPHRLRYLRSSVSDVWDRPSSEVFAVAAARARARPGILWSKAVQPAAARWVESNWPDLYRLLRNVPPPRRRYQDIFSLRAKVAANWREAGCPKTSNYASVKTLLRYCERVGVFKLARKRRYVWGQVWKYGLTDVGGEQ